MAFYREYISASLHLGPFFESSLLPWQGSTARVTSHIPDKGQVTFGGGTDFPLPTVAMDFRLRFLPPLLGQVVCPVLRPKGHTPLEPPG